MAGAVSGDGRWLALALGDDKVTLHDLHGTLQKDSQHLSGLTDRISMLRFSADSKLLVAGDCDNRVIVWPFDGDELVTHMASETKIR